LQPGVSIVPTPTVGASFLRDRAVGSSGAEYDRGLNRGERLLTSRLDEDKLDQLRRWGNGLAGAENQELRATGKAILLLIEEIEALHVDVWTAKTSRTEDNDADRDRDAAEAPSLDRALGSRLRRLGRAVKPGSGVAADE
jgi:hypothetical protein